MKLKLAVSLMILVFLCIGPAQAKNDKQKPLPPGLEKKAAKGKPLPPGWQKKLARGQVMDKTVYEHGSIVVPVDSHGLVTIRVEGKLVRLFEATREVVEVLQ
jgi:hypothetical protein